MSMTKTVLLKTQFVFPLSYSSDVSYSTGASWKQKTLILPVYMVHAPSIYWSRGFSFTFVSFLGQFGLTHFHCNVCLFPLFSVFFSCIIFCLITILFLVYLTSFKNISILTDVSFPCCHIFTSFCLWISVVNFLKSI